MGKIMYFMMLVIIASLQIVLGVDPYVIGASIIGTVFVTIILAAMLSTNISDMSLQERSRRRDNGGGLFGMFVSQGVEESELLVLLPELDPLEINVLGAINVESYQVQYSHSGLRPGLLIRKADLNSVLNVLERRELESSETSFVGITVINTESKDPARRYGRMISLLLSPIRKVIKDAEEHVRSDKKTYHKLLSKKFRLIKEKQKGGLRTRLEISSRYQLAVDAYESLLQHPEILKISLSENKGCITVYTQDIIVQESGKYASKDNPRWWKLGKMKIVIDLRKNRDEPVYYYHTNGSMKGTSHQAPHTDENGKPCWGGHAGVLKTLIKQRNYPKAVHEAIRFLQWANTADGWGENATNLPPLSQRQVQALEKQKVEAAHQRKVERSVTSHNLPKTGFYLVPDDPHIREVVKSESIKHMVIDDADFGISGLLIYGSHIHKYIEQVIGDSMSISLKDTNRSGIKQLLVGGKTEKDEFVRLLLDSMEGKDLSASQKEVDPIEQIDQEILAARRQYLTTVAGVAKNVNGYDNKDLEAGVYARKFAEEYVQMMENIEVQSLALSGNRLKVTTMELYCREAKLRRREDQYRWYNLGAMEISIDLSWSDDQLVRIRRIDGAIPNSDGLLQAPHVGRNGEPEWGILEIKIAELLGKFEIAEAIDEVIKFVTVARYDTATGKYVEQLPQIEADTIENLQSSKAQQKLFLLEEEPLALREVIKEQIRESK